MTAADFRRIALSLEGVEEYSHAGFPAFRVGGRKFASLCSQAEGYGNRLRAISRDVLEGALRTAWKLRKDLNAKTGRENTRVAEVVERSG
jgi:hypothetical protein